MAIDNEQYNINYPLVDGRIPWLRNAQLIVHKTTSNLVYPCPVHLKKEAGGPLVFKFGAVEHISVFTETLIATTSFMEDAESTWIICRLITDPSADLSNWDTLAFEYQLEPCCVLWLLEPMKDVLLTTLQENAEEGQSGLPFTVGANWTVVGDIHKLFVPDESPEEEPSPSGLYCINGLSGRKLTIKGSKSVNISVERSGTEDLPVNIIKVNSR